MRPALTALLLAVVAGAAGFVLLTQPRPLSAAALPDAYTPDPDNGRTLFWAGGCASCHAAPEADGDALLTLAGGLELPTPFGTFRVPNISSDREHGIGGWSAIAFVNAMRNGLSPDGEHYYPAFPYPYYRRMPIADLLDLKAFLDTLPAVAAPSPEHDLRFPYNFRRGLGLWKRRYLDAPADDAAPPPAAPVERGAYLVRALSHCGACHTPRDAFGGPLNDRFLAGAPELEVGDDGEPGWVPNITPHADGIGDWSEQDIAYALESGFDPDFDTFGGAMVAVQENLARLSADDRAAIAAYLKTVPARPSPPR